MIRRVWWSKRSLFLGVLLCAAVVVPAVSPGTAAAAGPCTPPVTNAVACENTLPGDPASDWAVQGVGDAAIQGYSTQFSVNVGQTESFKIKTPSTNYHIDILRLGYYAGNGARMIQAGIKPTATLPQTQPACQTTVGTGLIDCGNWSVSASWTVPSTAVSGVYIAHLVRDDASNPNGGSLIPFVVRNDASHSDMVVATSDATWQAYNNYGGNSLYDCTVDCPSGNPLAYKGADAVSYNRPFDGAFTTDNGASYLFYTEYQMIRFLERNGYDATYVSDSDLDNNGSLLLNHKLFISSGHDEYWSGNEYANVKNALAHGVNLAFFSGNEMFWKTRWAADSSGAADRTLITYKETHYNAPTDPQDPTTWTGAWADPRFSPPADGGIPANALTGQEFVVNSGTSDITVPYAYSKLRLWRNTGIANLTTGQTATLGAGIGTLGYEWDEDVDNGFRPAGEFDLSSTTVSGTQSFHDYGSLTGITTETHHLSLYRAPSGALVFGAGTVQWSWGLDNTNAWNIGTTDPSAKAPDPNMQQATVNLFADMGVQPATLMSGLSAATQSADTTPPTSTITSPTANASFADGSAQTITGTATDSGGGVVAGVEVSTDGGTTWHPATITTPDGVTVSWSYKWTAQGNPSTTIVSRATDDSANIETPGPGVSVNVSCPCSLWGSGTPGGTPQDSADPNAITVGMKFKSDVFGTISAIRFYKVTANTGTHIGSLWTSTGTLLASVTFSGETASGWQQATLSQPVPIMPNTTYVVSYYAPNGHYAATDNYFYPNPAPGAIGGGTIDNAPLHAIPQNTSGDGVYVYGSNSFPTTSDIAADNYWVDVQFSAATAPGPASNVKAVAGNSSAQRHLDRADDGRPCDVVRDHALPQRRGPVDEHRQRFSGADEHDGDGADQRLALHVHRDRDQPDGECRGIGPVKPGHAVGGDRRLRPTGRRPYTGGRQPRRDAAQPGDRGQPHRRGVRHLEQQQLDRHRRDRHGREHLHRAAALQSLRRYRDERVERAHHRRRRDQADGDRQDVGHRGHGRVGVGVLRALDGVRRDGARQVGAELGYHRGHRRHRLLRGDGGNHLGQRARHRRLRGLRLW